MYTPVLIDTENCNLFLPDLEIDAADFWIGMVEAETGAASGILGADFVEEENTLSLSVSYIQVPGGDEGQKVRRSLIEYLLYLAHELKCAAVYDTEVIPEESGDETQMLLSDLGFFAEEKSFPLYLFNLKDLSVKKTKSELGYMSLSELSDGQWDEFIRNTSDYSFTVMEKQDYDPDISIFLADDKKNLEAGILFRMRGDVLFVEVIAPYGSNEDALINDLIYWGADRARKRLGPDKKVQLYLPGDRTYRDILNEVTLSAAKKIGILVSYTYEVPVRA